MFVRFRQAGSRLQISLITTHRSDGKVRHEHVASLGAVGVPLSLADRVEFWRRLHERLARLSNRIDTEAQAKIMGEVHARIPMATLEEIRAVQLENAEADERVWRGLADMQTEQAEGNRQLAAQAERKAAEAQAEAEKASAGAKAAKERIERLKRGEAVAGGLGKQLTDDDVERILRGAGMTTADIEQCRQVGLITKLGGEAAFQELIAETLKRHRVADRAATRAVLTRQLTLALAEGRIKDDS